jgi:hypothetical protein
MKIMCRSEQGKNAKTGSSLNRRQHGARIILKQILNNLFRRGVVSIGIEEIILALNMVMNSRVPWKSENFQSVDLLDYLSQCIL